MTISVKNKVKKFFDEANIKIPQVPVPNPVPNQVPVPVQNKVPNPVANSVPNLDVETLEHKLYYLQTIMNEIMTSIQENNFVSLKSNLESKLESKVKLIEESDVPITIKLPHGLELTRPPHGSFVITKPGDRFPIFIGKPPLYTL